MPARLNVLDVHRRMSQQQAKRSASFEAVLAACCNRIKRHADNGRSDCILEVPAYLAGYPLFDLNACVRYVAANLGAEGFTVRLYLPKYVFVSWAQEPPTVRSAPPPRSALPPPAPAPPALPMPPMRPMRPRPLPPSQPAAHDPDTKGILVKPSGKLELVLG